MKRLLLLLCLFGCKEDKKPPPTTASASASASATAPASVTATATTPTTVTASATAPVDGGLCAIDLAVALDFVGAPTISITKPGEAQVIGNENGKPHAVTIAKQMPITSAIKTSSIPCTVAKGRTFCPDADGKIHTPEKVIATSRAGTKIAAAEVGGHAVMAYLEDKKTTEGTIQTAKIWSDDDQVQALSEEGNGATFVDLAARDGQALALAIDAHMGMTPVHARTMEWKNKLVLGHDVVVMVAGNAETHTQGVIATKHDKGPSFALLPIAKDISAFGVAAIELSDPPHVDAKVNWSLYDNGLDPAPIAATHDGAGMIAARVRPVGKDAKAPRILEIGKLDDAGGFTPLSTRGAAASVAIAMDGAAIWLAYEADVVRVERLTCP